MSSSRPTPLLLALTLAMLVAATLTVAPAPAIGAPAPAPAPVPRQDGGDAPTTARINAAAPPFELTDTKGQRRVLKDYKGRIVVLEWTDPNCPYVEGLYNRSKRMQKAYRSVKKMDKDVVWLAIDSTPGVNVAQLDHWIRRHGIEYPVMIDGDASVARAYDVRHTPHMFVIDKEGILRYHGAIDDNALGAKPANEVRNYVVQAVKELTEAGAVSTSHVKAYGCLAKHRHTLP